MRAILILVGGSLVLAFCAAHGLLMALSPRRHAAFVRWYTRSGNSDLRSASGVQIETRIAGVLLVLMCTFMGFFLVQTFLNGGGQRQ